MAPKRPQRARVPPPAREVPRDETAQLLRQLLERVTRLEGERQTPDPASGSGSAGTTGIATTTQPAPGSGPSLPAGTLGVPLVPNPTAPPLALADTLAFKRLNPPTFNGDRDYFGITEWISQMEKHFKYAGVSEAQRVLLATYQLTEDAYTWWLQLCSLSDTTNMTWEQFKEALMGNFLSSVERDGLAEKFLSLQQLDRTVTEFAREFSRLSLLAAEFVPDEAKKISRFVKGLRYDLQQLVVAHGATTFAETVGAALKVEAIELNRSARKVQHGTGNAATSDSKRKSAPPQEQGPKSREVCAFCHKVGHVAQVCRTLLKRQKQNVPAQQPQLTLASASTICTYCKRSGHQMKDCRRKLGACYRCGLVGHLALDCPMKGNSVPAQDKGKAVLNVISQSEARTSTDVISGTLCAKF